MSMEKMRDMVNQMLKPLRNRVYTIVSRAILEAANDSGKMQFVKVNLLAGESRSDVERFQNFGFSGNPPPGAEAVAVAVGGNRDHLIIVALDDRATRPTGLAPGESVFYNANGDKLVLKASGNLEGTLSNNLEYTLKKLKFTNGTDEVIDLLVQTLQALSIEPFIVNKATFTLLKTKLEAFKV